jgi:L-lactate dehydrogenase complex protein LldE
MKAGLFIPCYIDQFYPQVGIDTLLLLEKLGVKIESPADHIYELTEFLTDVLKIEALDGHFPHKVGLHQSCHGLRGLKNGKSSELAGKTSSKALTLLSSLKDIHLVNLDRRDECCGFGGTFSVFEEAVSARMGRDRIQDHIINGAEIITAIDMSCLMHMEGVIRRNRHPLRVMHVAEILNTATS